ncbi:hypothetical protein [Streptomyces sp. NPDC001880]
MPKGAVMSSRTPRPFLELRIGGLQVTMQRAPVRLFTWTSVLVGPIVAAWWSTR